MIRSRRRPYSALGPAFALAFALAMGAMPAVAEGGGIAGAFALRGATAKTTEILRVEPRGPLRAGLDFYETRAGAPLIFDVAMTQRMHCIVVSDDFATFLHVHPALAANGHFTFDLRVPKAGRYFVYADTDPHGLGTQVFRYAIHVGRPPDRAAAPAPPAAASSAAVRTGPYTVEIGKPDHAGGQTMLRVTIRKDGKTATDLRPYLGEAAHAVFIDAATLDYLHVHPAAVSARAMTMPMDHDMEGVAMQHPALAAATPVSGALALHVDLEPGTYRLWVQFRGAGGLHVAPFVLEAP